MNADAASGDSPNVTELLPEISFRFRFALWAAAWIIATVSAGGTSLQVLFWAWLFPVGLFGLFAPADWEPPGGLSILVLGWALYLWLTIYGLAQRKRYRYFVAYALLLVFLLINVVGCRVQQRQPFKIGC